MDDKAKKVFNDKLKGFEAPVADNLWASIDAGVNGGIAPLTAKRWKWVGILLLLLIFTGIGYSLYDGNTEEGTTNELELKPVEEPVTDEGELPIDTETQSVQDTDSASDVKLIPLLGKVTTKVAALSPISSVVSKNDADKTEFESTDDIPVNVEKEGATNDASHNLDVRKIYGLPFSHYHADIEAPVFHKLSLADSTIREVERTSRPITFKWHGALTFNYLNITPNTQDEVFFNAVSSGVNFSLDRIGIRPGIEMLIPINDKLSIKNDFLLSFRRYSIAFDYINDASQSENTFERFASSYSQITMGLSTGLSYQLITLAQRRIDFDFGVSMEQMISNQFKGELLLDSPGQLFSLNIGLSLHPKKAEGVNWIIRPFGYLSLNQKASAAPANLTPYGFGIQFSRNR